MRRTRTGSRPRAVLASVMALALVAAFAGCGDDDDDTDAVDPDDGPATETDAADDADDADDADETIVVRTVDYAFEDLPDTVSAGTTLRLVNDSENEVHELVAFRLPDDEERSVEDLLLMPPGEGEEEAEEDEGPPDMVIVAMPGEEGEVVLGDSTLTEPGRYAIGCFIPTGADPDEFMAAVEDALAEGADEGPPDVEGGDPHVVHGMYAELIVE